MKIKNRLGRWLRRAVTFLILGAGMAGTAKLGQAQGPVPAAKNHFTNKKTFNLPVRIPDQDRTRLKEICLYVKTGARDWFQQEVGPATQRMFTYTVPEDGEYWFSVATVDKLGRKNPPDISQHPPGLRVVVDTVPPVVDVKAWTAPDGETCLMCVVQDAHPDYQKLKVFHHGRDGVDRALEAHPNKAGAFRVTDSDLWGSPVRIVAADKCGNQTIREVRLPLPNAQGPVPNSQAHPTKTPGENLIPVGEGKVIPSSVPSVPPSSGAPVSPGPMLPSVPPRSGLSSNPMTFTPPAPLPKIPTSDPSPVSPESLGSRQVLNTTHASLEYRIEQVGPSGVGKVEIWITTNQGQTWQRLADDGDRRSPAEIDLPGEGLYGIRLVVLNGNGFGGKAPKRGDAPTTTIEVDTTPPFVQLQDIEPVTDGKNLEIRWTARDKNLGEEPVNLYYRTRPDAPWQVVAKNLKNTGSCHWPFPHDAGSQFFFRVEVADRAGNVARAESANPLVLDMSEPRASVVNVVGVNPRRP